ncbi:MAG: TOMM precursor leader peptide-binding protein [Rhodococcus sp. (in: high G+C Gram-positive bacteria)]
MPTTIRFRRNARPESVVGDGVYLASERTGHIRLHGRLVEHIAPLLTGDNTRSQVVSHLAETHPADRINRALDSLIEAGHVVEVDTDVDERAGAFWESHGADGDTAVRRLSAATVEVVGLGDQPVVDFVDALGRFGVTTSSSKPNLRIVLTDDYLAPELHEINRRALDSGVPWLLAKPRGSVLWIGPVFEPVVTACWYCLAARLNSNEMVRDYLRQHNGFEARSTALGDVPATRRTGVELTALHAASWLAGVRGPTMSTRGPDADSGYARTDLTTFDTVLTETVKHTLLRRPQCRECGDPTIQGRLHRTPITLTSQAKVAGDDGGHRSRSAEDFLADYQPLVSPITGAVKQLTKLPTEVDGLHTYHAGQNFAVPMSHISDLRAGLRSAASGKGRTDSQARASAVGEAIERYSGIYRGDEARIRATYNELGPEEALAPNDIHQFSEQQFIDRAEWNARGSHFQRVCDPFDPDQEIDWTPIWSLTNRRFRYAPTASLFFGYPVSAGNRYAGADSNGNAAGTCLEDAIVQGFMELVERDSVAIWWYNMLRVPRIDLDSFDDSYFRQWENSYRAANREVWALDVTSDLGIPSVVTVSRRVDKPVEDILIAFGAHFDVRVAISRAMTEMNQFLPAVIGVNDENDEYAFPDPDQHRWWRTATINNQPYLLPDPSATRSADDYVNRSTDDLADDVTTAQSIVEAAGMEMLVLDQTRPDLGLPVAKVIVPGMRHFWTRYAPGRLFDVPVATGTRTEPIDESALNPIGMFL